MNQQPDWISAAAILSAGLILGLMVMYFFRRGKSVQPDTHLRDLEAKRDLLLQMIRSADGEERTRLELEAAQVLRELDHVEVKGPRTSPERKATRRLSPTAVGFLWGVASTLALVGLVFFVSKYAENRKQDTSPTAMQQPAQRQAPDPAVQSLEKSVQEQPDNLDMRIALARAYLERDNMMGVFEQTQFVLSKSPNDARALTYQALVRMAMGDNASANQMLQSAIKSDPSLLDAWVTLAWVQTQEGKIDAAEKTIREAMKRQPQEKARLQQVLDQMKAHPSTSVAAAAPATAPSAPPATPAGESGVRITLDNSSSQRTGTLFVIARAAGVTAGPPVAAKRMSAGSFPMTVELTSADSMMGQPLPATMRIEARLDIDGNATTKTPNEPSAVQDGVATGSAITLTLK